MVRRLFAAFMSLVMVFSFTMPVYAEAFLLDEKTESETVVTESVQPSDADSGEATPPVEGADEPEQFPVADPGDDSAEPEGSGEEMPPVEGATESEQEPAADPGDDSAEPEGSGEEMPPVEGATESEQFPVADPGDDSAEPESYGEAAPPAESEDEGAQLAVTTDFSADVEKQAIFNEAYPDEEWFFVLDCEPSASWSYNPLVYQKSEFAEDTLFTVSAYKVVEDTYAITDEESGAVIGEKTELTLWYQVNVIGGTAEGFEDGYWIMQNYLNEEDIYPYDVLTLQDAPEQEPTQSEKTDPETGVSVSAKLPENTELTVTGKTLAETGLNTNIFPVSESALFYDITLSHGDENYQPTEGVSVTFPESAITQSGISVGDSYHIYHIHDGITDMTGPFVYNGGSISVDLESLFVVGIAKTNAPISLTYEHGTYRKVSISATTLSIASNAVTLYDSFDTNVYTANISGMAGTTIEAVAKVTFADGFVLYQYAYYGDDADFDAVAGTYQFIPADVLGESAEEEQHPCAICGEINCTVYHLYCDICGEFDCGQTHPYEDPYKPETTPTIPEYPELDEHAEVSVVNAKGKTVPATGILLYKGEKTSLSAWSYLEDEGEVSYQWQICYDTEKDLWADIQDQTGKGILLSPAMVQSILQLTNRILLRCRLTCDTVVRYSSNIPVTVVETSSAYRLARTASSDAALYEETPELGEYTVVINYVFENNDIVADPYTATLAAGSNFKANVPHPNIMGYLPYNGNDTVSSTQFTLDITNIQKDMSYTVTYKPSTVDYTVIHYLQNIDNDNYTIEETEPKSGLTKTIVPDVANDYTGFYALLYNHPPIAADGSTVVEIRYDRNYYLVNFELDGGYGMDPIYARYETPIVENTPVNVGYTFLGWTLDGTTIVDLPTTVPAQNVTYKALWKQNTSAKLKVVFWGENPNNEEYSHLSTGMIDATPGAEYTFTDGSTVFLICGKDEHTHTAECALSCGKTEHTTHTAACFNCGHCGKGCYSANGSTLVSATKPSQIQTPTENGIYTYTTTSYIFWTTTHYYLYLDGAWYRAQSGDETEITYTCDHKHTADCYSCEYHEHSAACYPCGKVAHTHSSSCNQTGSGLSSALWTFKSSETVTVAADGTSVVNVYYDRTSFTLTFKNEGNNGSTLGTITDKWGADIKERFETISGANTFFWSLKQNGGSPWTSFLDVMPAENRTYYADPQSGSTTITATYLVEKLDGSGEYETLYTVTFKGSSSITVSEEEFTEIEGLIFNAAKSAKVGDRYNGAKFYYDRHRYAIEYYDPFTLLKRTENVIYEAPLSSHAWELNASHAPAQYPPNSVVFEGWYLNPECTGEKFNFDTHTMPAGTKDGDTALTLYAKWIGAEITVSFYLDLPALNAGTKLATHPDISLSHGEKVTPVPATPTNGSYTFVGWFYMDGGVEKAFDFANMAINKNMQVYGKWSSNVLESYFVYFKLQGTDTEIADPITGSDLAGTTKTFDAKGGSELYSRYQEGFFPLVKSHSMRLDIENAANNVFTFWYVQREAVPYTVKYLDEETGEPVASEKTIANNRKAVVTESFKEVAGMMPDAYQKRLVVDSSDGAVNEIIFYYTKNTTHAYYKITHYTQNLDGETWTEYASSQTVGIIGQTYSADVLAIDGFSYDSSADGTLVSGKLTASGLELKLYYVRNDYPYEVRYLKQGSGTPLATPKTGFGKYGQTISESAIAITDYVAVDPDYQTMNIRIEEDATPALNIITFYYAEREITINYAVVGSAAGGTLSQSSESVKVVTGSAFGSTATANPNYKFVGWYSDITCAHLLSTNARYVPVKPTTGWTNATYYAKFELALADLTIKKSGWSLSDENQSFIFTVTGPKDFSLDVVIKGNGSVTITSLPIGEYTVTESDWSWRYSPAKNNQVITLSADSSQNVVEFSNSRRWLYWLSGDCYCENRWENGTVVRKDDTDE